MTRLRAALYGGANYGDPDETFATESLSEVRAMWEDRVRSNGIRKCEYRHADGTVEYLYCPCWGESAPGDVAAQAWYCHPGDTLDPIHEYPDRRLIVGPRGGLRWERC